MFPLDAPQRVCWGEVLPALPCSSNSKRKQVKLADLGRAGIQCFMHIKCCGLGLAVRLQSIPKLSAVPFTAIIRAESFSSQLGEVMVEMKCGHSIHGVYTFDFCT